MQDASAQDGKKGFRAWISNAFAVEDKSNPIGDEDLELLERVAGWIVGRRMAAPSIVFLESVRPLGYLGGQALIFLEPVLTLFLNEKDYKRFVKILEKREAVSILIDKITDAENGRVAPSPAASEGEGA